jgi:NAD(P)-dependent dehydrogenase (short-subunit alcohol dehydrogenase family)
LCAARGRWYSAAVAFETTTDDVLRGVDLTGRTAVVTGASAGLGLETARALASAGAHVVLAVRDRARGAAAAVRIGGATEVATVDLASLASVRAFADWFGTGHDSLELLVNNAGVMATPLLRTADGFELQFGTNHLGHFLLTLLLVPALRAGAPARVVTVSSAGHRASDVDFDDPNYERRPYDKWEAYGQAKTANILFAVELDRRLAPFGVRAFSLHPGMITTELGRHLSRDDYAELGRRAAGRLPARKTVAQGAATTVWAATAPGLDDHGGAYLEDCAVSDAHAPWARDPVRAARLWRLSERLVGATLQA